MESGVHSSHVYTLATEISPLYIQSQPIENYKGALI
jgi:hypothetical protein